MHVVDYELIYGHISMDYGRKALEFRLPCSNPSIYCMWNGLNHNDVIMGAMASQIDCLLKSIVYSSVYSSADQRKHQSSASLALVRGIHLSPINSPHKGPVTRKMFPLDDVIMGSRLTSWFLHIAANCVTGRYVTFCWHLLIWCYHTETETKWPPFCGWCIHRHVLNEKCCVSI